MTGAVTGAVLGLTASAGAIVAVRAAPPLRPIRLVDRVAPYLVDATQPTRLLDATAPEAAPFAAVRRIAAPALTDAVRRLDRLVGGASSVRRRLGGLGERMTVEEFRVEQVVWGVGAMLAGACFAAIAGVTRGAVDPVLVAAVGLAGLAGGVVGRDHWLSRRLSRRERTMLAEFPVVADLLALAVVAGEAPVAALARVCRLTGGELASDLGDCLARARAGTPLTRALTDLGERTTLEPLARFVQGIAVAIERGTPLADVLRAQAVDVRELHKRTLLEAGGKKEVAMMVPVVFMILPITVVFALYPGLLTLTSLAR